jgi:hypothetical protein
MMRIETSEPLARRSIKLPQVVIHGCKLGALGWNPKRRLYICKISRSSNLHDAPLCKFSEAILITLLCVKFSEAILITVLNVKFSEAITVMLLLCVKFSEAILVILLLCVKFSEAILVMLLL